MVWENLDIQKPRYVSFILVTSEGGMTDQEIYSTYRNLWLPENPNRAIVPHKLSSILSNYSVSDDWRRLSWSAPSSEI